MICSSKTVTGEGNRICLGRGKYVSQGEAADRLFCLQVKYSRGIYSHETALYLHGYLDGLGTVAMTCPQGYNVSSMDGEGVTVRKLIPDNYGADIEEIRTEFGNPVRVYSIERTLCDLLRGTKTDHAVINAAMKRYAASPDCKPDTLLEVADRLRVRPKVLPYMEILM